MNGPTFPSKKEQSCFTGSFLKFMFLLLSSAGSIGSSKLALRVLGVQSHLFKFKEATMVNAFRRWSQDLMKQKQKNSNYSTWMRQYSAIQPFRHTHGTLSTTTYASQRKPTGLRHRQQLPPSAMRMVWKSCCVLMGR